MGIVSDLSDLFADTLVAQPGSMDGFGTWTASGDALSMPCHIEGEARLVRNAQGAEVVSSVQVFVGVTAALVDAWVALGWSGWVDEDWVSGSGAFPSILTLDGYRFKLPVRFSPNGRETNSAGLEAIAIERADDEDGAHHEVVLFQ